LIKSNQGKDGDELGMGSINFRGDAALKERKDVST
jgi:hypothetical protein